MDKQELQQKIAEYYSKLPENLQHFFAEMKWINILQDINTKYNLSPEQIETLATETTLVLLCIVDMSDYVKTIENNIKLPTEQMDKLMSEINDNIFKDIGYELEDAFTKNINDLAEKNSQKEQIINSNPEIPLPPYKEELEMKEEEKEEKNYIIPPVNKEEIPIKNEQDVYKSTSTQIIGNKLFNSTMSTQTTSDHSLPKISPKKDPYKEEI